MTKKNIHSGSHLIKYIQHAPWYLLSSIITKAAHFLMLPVYTSYISPEDFGILASLESLGRLLPIFISLYMDAAFARFYFYEKNISQENINTLYSTHFWFIVVWGFLISFILYEFAPLFFDEKLQIPNYIFLLLIISQILTQLSVMIITIWKANLLAKRISIFQTIVAFSGIIITLVLLVVFDFGWESRIYGIAYVAIIQSLILVLFAALNGWVKFEFNKYIFLRSLKFSVPLIPNIAAGWIAGFSDRIILIFYGKLEEGGLYSMAAQLGFIIYILTDSISQIQGPLAMSGLTSEPKKAKMQISEFINEYFCWIMVCYAFLCLFSFEIIILMMDQKYNESWKLVYFLGFIYVIGGLYRVFTNIISFYNKTWVISVAAIIQASINICLNLIFIPLYGMYAAAISSVLSMLGYFIFILYWSQKIDRIEMPWKTLLYIGLVGQLISICPYLIHTNNEIYIINTIIKAGLFFLFLILVLKFTKIKILNILN